MTTRNDQKPEGPLDPDQVGEAAALTIKDLRARLGELRVVETLEQELLANPAQQKNSSDR